VERQNINLTISLSTKY